MKKNMQIEGLRGIGCLMVFLFHVTFRYCDIYQKEYVLPDWLSLFKEFGTYGVLIFFIISFFFLGNSNTGTMIKLLLKKYYKLLIPYIISISITFCFEQFLDLKGRTVDVKTFLVNLTMLQGLLGVEDVDGAHWYLYSLLVLSAWILVIEKKCKYRILGYFCWLMVTELSTALDLPERIFQTRFTGVAVFVIMCRYIVDNESKHVEKIFTILVALIALADTIVRHGFSYAVALIFFLGIFLLCYYSRLPFLENCFWIYLGEISLYVYLIHQNMAFMIQNTLSTAFGSFSLLYCFVSAICVWMLALFIKKLSEKAYEKCGLVYNNLRG